MIGLCEFETIDDREPGLFRCRKCGYEPPAKYRVPPHTVQRQCDADGTTATLAEGLKAVTRYAAAIRRWVRAGSPTRSDTEVDRIATVCESCPKFANGNCLMCGCPVRNVRQEQASPLSAVVADGLRNKIRMATEDCPLRCKACRKSKWECDCGRPPMRFPDRTILRTNLIYHCCPLMANDGWRENLAQIIPCLSKFSGRRVLSVSTGDGLHGITTVAREFGRQSAWITWLMVPNDRELRETVSLRQLLRHVESTNPNEATFYAHTKGNSTAGNVAGARLWRNAMYRELLHKAEDCLVWLEKYDAVGTHKMRFNGRRPPYPTKLAVGSWMFAGTFFWFRHDAVFSQPNWSTVASDRYGAEAWISTVIDADRARSVYQPWPEFQYPTPSPYDPKLYQMESDQ